MKQDHNRRTAAASESNLQKKGGMGELVYYDAVVFLMGIPIPEEPPDSGGECLERTEKVRQNRQSHDVDNHSMLPQAFNYFPIVQITTGDLV